MIRMVLIGFSFAALTVALVVLQPGALRRAAENPAPDPVTRAEAAGAVPVAVQGAIARTSQSLGPIVSDPVAASPVRAAVTVQGNAALSVDDREMRQMTWEALSGLNQITGRESAPGQPGSLLHTIVRRSLAHEVPGGTSGDLRAPSASNGSVLSALSGTTSPVPVPADAPRLYVVQPGDSLVSIADRVYGDVNMTGPLFAANQADLPRPDSLRPGQTLILP
jgi:nucleoid-associated protein YgaU